MFCNKALILTVFALLIVPAVMATTPLNSSVVGSQYRQDSDHDGVADNVDNYPSLANADQTDTDYDDTNSDRFAYENRALEFFASSPYDYVHIPGSSAYAFGSGDFTIEMWICPDLVAGDHRMLFCNHTLDNCQLNFWSSGTNTTHLSFYANGAGYAANSVTWVLGRWYHVAVSRISGTLYFCRDGVGIGSSPCNESVGNTTDIDIGYRTDPSLPMHPFDGKIDEVRVWNIGRTQSEIAASYDHIIDPNTNGLVGYWRFDETSGQVVKDLTPAGNHGTLGETSAVEGSDPARVSPGAPILPLPHDASVLRIVAPDTTVSNLTTLNPQALVCNVGENADIIPIIFQIGSIYCDTSEVTLAPGDSGVVTFAEWNADSVGSFNITCFTALVTDEYRGNDTLRSVVAVVGDTTAPVIFSITPNSGGNTGAVMVTIIGDKFQDGAGVRLESEGAVIVPEEAAIVNVLSANTIRAIINLQGAPPGLYDLVVKNPNGGVGAFYGAFVVEVGREDLWTAITGPSVLRVGRRSTFLIQFGNAGNDDAWGSSLLLTIPPRVSYEIVMDDGSSLTGIINTGDDTTHYAIVAIPYLPQGGRGTVQLRLNHSELTSASIRAGLYASLDQFWEPRWEVFDTTGFSAWLVGVAARSDLVDLNGEAARTNTQDPPLTPCTPEGTAGPPGTIHNLTTNAGQEFSASVGNNEIGFMDYTPGGSVNPIQVAPIENIPIRLPGAKDYGGIAPWPGMTDGQSEIIKQVFERWEQKGGIEFCSYKPGDPCVTHCSQCGFDLNTLETPCCVSCVGLWLRVLKEAATILCEPNTSSGPCEWLKRADAKWGDRKTRVTNEDVLNLARELHSLDACPPGVEWIQCMKDCVQASTGSKELPITGAKINYDVLGSRDPNGKSGPAGFSESGFIRPDLPMTYLVHFENDSSATLFSDTVWVADTLSTNLDWNTLEFGMLSPGDGPNSIRPNFNAVTSFDPIAGVAMWALCDINLPPDTVPYWGEGWVSYTVRPKPNLPSGTRIENIAGIKFDVNDWILAPMDSLPIFNTIDAGMPVSSVLHLPDTAQLNSFQVCWTAQDDSAGSGIGSVEMYVSENGFPYDLWLMADSSGCSTYVGNWNSTYEFYSVARDNVGHSEGAPYPLQPDAVTHVPECTCPNFCDVNRDGVKNAVDVVVMVNYVYKTVDMRSPIPTCPKENGDWNCDGIINAVDVVLYVNFVYKASGDGPCDPCTH